MHKYDISIKVLYCFIATLLSNPFFSVWFKRISENQSRDIYDSYRATEIEVVLCIMRIKSYDIH